MTLVLRSTSVLVFSVSWGQISGGSILNGLFISAAIIGGGSWAVRQFKKDSAESQQQALDAMQTLYDATDRQLQLEKESHAALSEAFDAALQESHRLELVVKDREKVIAALEARPDTQAMLRVFDEHHTQNQDAMKQMIENQTAGLKTLETACAGIEKLLDRNRERRASDTRE